MAVAGGINLDTCRSQLLLLFLPGSSFGASITSLRPRCQWMHDARVKIAGGVAKSLQCNRRVGGSGALSGGGAARPTLLPRAIRRDI